VITEVFEMYYRKSASVVACVISIALFLVLSGCSRQSTQTSMIQIKGSDTMVNLGQAWAEAYMKTHPGVNVAVTGGGSGTGIAAMIDGRTDIAESSRQMKPEEVSLAKKHGVNPVEHVVAIDALSVIVHPSNPVGKLTISQLSDIFTGRITNWKQVGGKDEKIVILSRDRNSGSHVFFLEHVVRKGNEKGPEEFAKTAIMAPSSESIASQVATDRGAIGYVGLGYVDPSKHKTIAVANNPSGPFVSPSIKTAQDGTYPIARPLYWYTKGEPVGEIKSFLEYVKSPEGQRIVSELGFAPIKNP